MDGLEFVRHLSRRVDGKLPPQIGSAVLRRTAPTRASSSFIADGELPPAR